MTQNRRNWLLKTVFAIASIGLSKITSFAAPSPHLLHESREGLPNHVTNKANNMKLGAFSISLTVKDITVSKQFYETLGFNVFAGGMEKKYLIMKNEHSLIGLFQGMFEGNILTFNPGWDDNASNIETFDDVREIQRQLKGKGIQLTTEADEKTAGPAGFMVTDPDENVILVDQHR